MSTTIYDFTLTTGEGNELCLSDYKNKVMLIVNTATECGFTPQYEELEKMYSDLNPKGLEIIDIPCNQFKEQAPGTDEEIRNFCRNNFNTEFMQMKKSDVNGKNELPLYSYLKSKCGFEGFGNGPKALIMTGLLMTIDPSYKTKPDIKWNFTKFVVDRDGNVVKRFEPTESMENVRKYVVDLL